jgi:DNA repair exonuclease SbcCD nuclease subunit
VDRVKLVITSDNHLNRYYDRLPPARLAARRRWLRQGFQAAVEFALERGAHLFLQAGDLFDTPDPRNAEREFVAEQFARLRAGGVEVVGIGGNHDTPKQRWEQGGSLPQGVYAHLGGLHLLDAGPLPTLTLDLAGQRVCIGALPWVPSRLADEDPLAEVTWQPRGEITLFVFHHSIEGHVYPGANEAIVRRASLDRLPAQLVVAGHVHQHAVWTTGRQTVVIPGATEQLTFGERQVPGFVYAEVSAHGVERLEHVPVPCQPRRDLVLHTWALRAAGDDLCAAALRQIDAVSAPELLLRVRLSGPIRREDYPALDLRRLREAALERVFACEIDTSGLVVEDALGLRTAGGVRVSAREALEASARALIDESDDPAERALLAEALAAVLAAYEQGTPA